MTRRAVAIMVAVLWGCVCMACTFPRIIVLKDPLTAEEHMDLGFAYEQKKEYGLAIKEYEAAAKKLPKANLYLANARFLNNEPDRAEVLYRSIIKEDPQCADAYNNLAWLLYTQKRNLPEARELASKAISLNPAGRGKYIDTFNKIEQEINKSKMNGGE
jgi:tetratricopeptide (TPR) repeat protein